MKQLDRPLARRTLIKGAGLGLVAAGMADPLLAQGAEAAPGEGSEIWSQEYWAKKGDIPLVDVPQTDWRAQGRRGAAAGAVLCPRLVSDFADV